MTMMPPSNNNKLAMHLNMIIVMALAVALFAGLPSSALAVDDAHLEIAQPDVTYMARLVYEAKRHRGYFPDFYRINPGLSDDTLYAVQRLYVERQLANKDYIAGYKSGFVPRAPLGGVVLGNGILAAGSEISAKKFRLLIVEAELAFIFCANVEAPVADVVALKSLVCELAPAFEIADGALADFAEVKADFAHLRQALIPLNVAYDHIMLGQPVAADTIELSTLPVTMTHNQRLLGERSLTPASDLWSNLLWAVNNYVLRHGYVIKKGHFIIPGNLTGVHVGTEGEYTANFGPVGRLQLKVNP